MITLRAAFVGIHGRGAWARSSGIALSGAVAQTAPGPDNPRALAGHSRRRRNMPNYYYYGCTAPTCPKQRGEVWFVYCHLNCLPR